MGAFWDKLYDAWPSMWISKGDTRVLLLGLDGAGKTTILYKVKLDENVNSIPTIGFNVEQVTPCKGVTFTVWDVGGQTKIRPLWHHYYQNCQGLFYVIDSSDVDRVNESREELHAICEHQDMRGVPVVIMANKQDLANAMAPAELVKRLNLDKLAETRNKWFLQRTCAKTGEGVYEAMKQLADMIKENR